MNKPNPCVYHWSQITSVCVRAFRNHVSICGTDDESYAFVFVVVVALHTGKTNDNEMTAFRIVDLCDLCFCHSGMDRIWTPNQYISFPVKLPKCYE